MIRLRRVPFLDAKGLQAIEEVALDLPRWGVQVLLCEANTKVLEKMRRSGLVDKHSVAQHCDTLEQAFHHVRLATEAT